MISVLANPEGAEAVLETPEGARAVIGTQEKAEAVVRTPEGAGAVAVVEPLEEAETLKRGRGTSGGFRRTAQTGPQVQVAGCRCWRVKKCRAVHGLDQKELWCKPCINSKK